MTQQEELKNTEEQIDCALKLNDNLKLLNGMWAQKIPWDAHTWMTFSELMVQSSFLAQRCYILRSRQETLGQEKGNA